MSYTHPLDVLAAHGFSRAEVEVIREALASAGFQITDLTQEQAKALSEGIGEFHGLGPWGQGDPRYTAFNEGRAELRRLSGANGG